MTHVFVFLGEFGYELLNWQGVVRKFLRLHPEIPVICASRSGVEALYEGAEFVDIGDVPKYRDSVATGYFARLPGEEQLDSEANLRLDARLRSAVKTKVGRSRLRPTRYVFSSEVTEIDRCVFGADRRLYGLPIAEGDIYYELDLSNNLYSKLRPALEHREALERRLDQSLDEPFIMVQTRKRATEVTRSERTLDEGAIVEALQAALPVVLVDLATARAGDSHSTLARLPHVKRVQISGLGDQSCLIHHAVSCVFLTEGDYGSHIYLPPLFGRDVWSVAARDVYELGTAPIELWNRGVFRFGGRIHPVVAEEIEHPAGLARFAESVAAPARMKVR
jgi:hypothetical protein